MKKIIISTVCVVIAFIAGALTGFHGCESKYSLIKTNANTIPYKIEVIKAQHTALNAADEVMDNHQLFDTDGSDAMVKYLDLASKVDSLYKLENQGLCSSLSKILSKPRSQYTLGNCPGKLLKRAVGTLKCV